MNDQMLKEATDAIDVIEAAKPRPKERFAPKSFKLGDYKPEPDFFEVEGRNTVHVYWGGYDYAVHFEDEEGPCALLRVVRQMAAKGWPLMTPNRIARFINVVANVRGIDFFGDSK